VSLNQGTVTVRNNGPTTAVITYYIGVNGGGQQTIAALSPQLAVAPRGTVTFSVSNSFKSVGEINLLWQHLVEQLWLNRSERNLQDPT